MGDRGWERVVWLVEEDVDEIIGNEYQVFTEIPASRISDGEDESFVSVDEVEREFARLEAENERLRANQRTPGEESRSNAWLKVWLLCHELGMTGGGFKTGENMVLDFIRGLHEDNAELRESNEHLSDPDNWDIAAPYWAWAGIDNNVIDEMFVTYVGHDDD